LKSSIERELFDDAPGVPGGPTLFQTSHTVWLDIGTTTPPNVQNQMKSALRRKRFCPAIVALSLGAILWTLAQAPTFSAVPLVPAPTGSPVAPPPSKAGYERFALRTEGDPLRGRALFLDEQRLGCNRCHAIEGKGGKVGPDLFAVGDKFGRRDIIDSLLSPSSTIAVGYSTTTLVTKSGEQYQGIIKQADASSIELMGADAKPVRIATSEIKERRTSEVSLMPEGLQAALTLQEFVDLVEYVVSLKQPESASVVEHGMPAVIPELARPIALRPFHSEALKFEHPVWFGPLPGVPDAFLVAEHETGKLWRLEKGAPGETKTLFADLEPFIKGTRGVLGLAFHPRFRENRKYYFAKHVVENGHFATLIFEREAAADFKSDSGRPARLLLKLDATTNVHYGGGLAFGPDGYFYIGMGDTGPQEDPQGQGQNSKLLIGKMLRIDVDHRGEDRPYAIPSDNPFIGRPDFRPEIWAYGFREPWRFSFDPATGDLWVGDVGQDRYEEVDIVRRGENYGWNVYEGFAPFSNRYRKEGATYTAPVFAYNRKYGPSVTGGHVYRANSKSTFYGTYIFGDYETRRVWGLTQENRILKKVRLIGMSPQKIVSFGLDEKGEIYLVGYEGTIYKMDFEQAKFGE
jgi:putative heme-binding domain-containing protein